jgi:CRISPR-associated endonuclease/helicase Cas3
MAHLKSKQGVLCISTQLIEAGVDVDFGAVIRYAAGLDSIAQAAGRCNRNGNPIPGRVHVIEPQGENLDGLGEINRGRESGLRVFREYNDNPEFFGGDPIGPKAIDLYYTYAFFDPPRMREMDYPVTADAVGRDDTLLNMLSVNCKAVGDHARMRSGHTPDFHLRQSFMSAAGAFRVIDAPTQGVVVPFGSAGNEVIGKLAATNELDVDYGLLPQAQQFTVNVFPHELETLQKSKAVYEVPTGAWSLRDRYYSSETGLSLKLVTDMEERHA